MKATDLRPGYGVKIDGKLAVLTGVEHRTPGNLRAFIQIKFKEILSGKTIERRLGSSDDIEVVDLDRREMEYLYSDSSGATFMDTETYDQVNIKPVALGEAADYLIENAVAIIATYEGEIVSVEIPAAVELEIAQTEPGIQGDRVSGARKPATLQTGKVIQVPLFINIGDRVKVDTRTGDYITRV